MFSYPNIPQIVTQASESYYRLTMSKNTVSTYTRLSAVTSLQILTYLHVNKPIPVAARSKAWVCCNCGFESRWGHGYLSLLSVLSVCVCVCVCFVRYRSRRRADHLSRGDLPNAACLSVISKPQQWGRLDLPGLSKRKKQCLKLKMLRYVFYYTVKHERNLCDRQYYEIHI